MIPATLENYALQQRNIIKIQKKEVNYRFKHLLYKHHVMEKQSLYGEDIGNSEKLNSKRESKMKNLTKLKRSIGMILVPVFLMHTKIIKGNGLGNVKRQNQKILDVMKQKNIQEQNMNQSGSQIQKIQIQIQIQYVSN